VTKWVSATDIEEMPMGGKEKLHSDRGGKTKKNMSCSRKRKSHEKTREYKGGGGGEKGFLG